MHTHAYTYFQGICLRTYVCVWACVWVQSPVEPACHEKHTKTSIHTQCIQQFETFAKTVSILASATLPYARIFSLAAIFIKITGISIKQKKKEYYRLLCAMICQHKTHYYMLTVTLDTFSVYFLVIFFWQFKKNEAHQIGSANANLVIHLNLAEIWNQIKWNIHTIYWKLKQLKF